MNIDEQSIFQKADVTRPNQIDSHKYSDIKVVSVDRKHIIIFYINIYRHGIYLQYNFYCHNFKKITRMVISTMYVPGEKRDNVIYCKEHDSKDSSFIVVV